MDFATLLILIKKTLCGYIYELIEIFYEYKNETLDLVTDDELISFMRKSFDGVCHGDLNYLSGTVMYELRRKIFSGKSIDSILKEVDKNE